MIKLSKLSVICIACMLCTEAFATAYTYPGTYVAGTTNLVGGDTLTFNGDMALVADGPLITSHL